MPTLRQSLRAAISEAGGTGQIRSRKKRFLGLCHSDRDQLVDEALGPEKLKELSSWWWRSDASGDESEDAGEGGGGDAGGVISPAAPPASGATPEAAGGAMPAAAAAATALGDRGPADVAPSVGDVGGAGETRS
jgi:hypothetical protein